MSLAAVDNACLSFRCLDLPCVSLDPSTPALQCLSHKDINSVRTGTLPCSASSDPAMVPHPKCFPCSDSHNRSSNPGRWVPSQPPSKMEENQTTEVVNLVQRTKAGNRQSWATNAGSLTPEFAGQSTRKRLILVNCRSRTFSSDETMVGCLSLYF